MLRLFMVIQVSPGTGRGWWQRSGSAAAQGYRTSMSLVLGLEQKEHFSSGILGRV